MKIKVCGNTTVSQLKELDSLEVDYAGFIFYGQSPRNVLEKLSGPEVKDLNLSIQKTGVFVNAGEAEILDRVNEYGLDLVQLHGDETAAFSTHISEHVKVIKAFRIQDENTNIDWLVKEYKDACDFYLFDKASAGLYGGTGEKFNWDRLEEWVIGKPFFLSGGISIKDVDTLKKFQHPFFYGVDVNSRFETAPGIKNIPLVREFINTLKEE